MRNVIVKIVVIYGQNHKGSTYHIAHELAEKIGGEITEFFLPGDFKEFCTGCTTCFVKGEENCPHYDSIHPITKALDEADVIVLASPVYVFHASGPMKNLLDHYGYRWMVHRPEKAMFSKQGVCISTAAGAGMKSTNKDMTDSLFFWGVAKIYKYGIGVAAVDWNGVSDKKKQAIERRITKLSRKIRGRYHKVKPGIKTKVFFSIMRLLQRNGFNERDVSHWKNMGWIGRNRPWR